MHLQFTITSALEQRFWAKVIKSDDPDGCWEWRAHKVREYGEIYVGGGKSTGAHRVSYRLHYGGIPEGMHVLHHCDNPGCTNPKHLFLGTQRSNIEDMVHKGRQARGVTHGWHTHPENIPIGEDTSNAKLTWGKISDIREGYAAGMTNMNQLAEQYGVEVSEIHAIIHHRRWRNPEVAAAVHDSYSSVSHRARGEHNGKVKFTWDQVCAIRGRFSGGKVTKDQLAVEFGVNKTTIRNIVTWQSWKSKE